MQILQIFLAIFGLLNVAFAGSLYFHSDKNTAVSFYCLISIFASLWSLSTLLTSISGLPFFFFKIGANGHYIFGYLAYLSFFWFALFYPKKIEGGIAYSGGLIITIISGALLIAIPTTDVLFRSLQQGATLRQEITFNLIGYQTFIAALSTVFVIGLFILIHRFNTMGKDAASQTSLPRSQIFFAILSNFVAGILGITFNLLLPLYGNFSLFYINPIFVTTALTGIGFYNLLHYRLFSARTVLAEFFTAAIWIVFLTRLLFNPFSTSELIINGIYLGCTTIFGFFLIRSVLQEVRQRELIEKQEKELEIANRAQENLIHFISHEVKGYLAKSEAAFAGILEGDYGAITDDLKGMVTIALGEMKKGVETVMDILQAGDFKKGTVALHIQPVDIKQLVEKTVEQEKPEFDKKHLTLDVQIAPGDYGIEADASQIGKHVVHNLIDNALKYTPSGTVWVSLKRVGDKVQFLVKDSGVGISPEDKGRLFTEGGRGKDSIKVNAHSTGYGLYIAKSIVTAHGGKVWADSEGQGKGSTFCAELPVKPPQPEQKPAPISSVTPPVPAPGTL